MGKNLLIVESPTKAKTLGKYLGNNFRILASVGHIKDLPKSKLGVEVQDDFRPEYVTIKGKGKVLQELKKAAKSAEAVYLAPDPDREGEAIAWHIAQELKSSGKDLHRVLFNELTPRAIKGALASPQHLNQHVECSLVLGRHYTSLVEASLYQQAIQTNPRPHPVQILGTH